MTLYEITYMVTNVFQTYIIYKLMHVFFNDTLVNRKGEIISYTRYYLVSSGAFFVGRIPIIMMVLNILLFFRLTLNYRASIKKRICIALLTFMILMCIEVFIGILTGLLSIKFFSSSQYASVSGILMIRVASLLVVSVISNLKNVKKDIPVPGFYWFSILFVPIASLYLFAAFFSDGQLNQIEVALVLMTILIINFIMLILYDNLYRIFSFREEKLILEQQNSAYEKQMELIAQSVKITDMIRHDMKNHLIALQKLYSAHRPEEAEEYVSHILSSAHKREVFADTGNYMIDSIINFKLQAATDMDIQPDLEIMIPQDIKVSPYVVTVVFGNLLDNALTALAHCTKEKRLSVYADYQKDSLIVTIINSYNGTVKEKNGKLLSLKTAAGHGLGLASVEETLGENGGYLDLQYDGMIFQASALLPVL